MRRSEIIMLGLVLISFLIGIYFYPQMPAQMASHWGANGEVNGTMPKFWGVFFLPFMLVGLALLFAVLPRIDPLKHNVEQFRSAFDTFILFFFIFMLAVYLQTLLWNTGLYISFNLTIPIGVGLLFYFTGTLLEKAKRNWFIGIRTPWTLSSEEVWDKTHQVGGKLFKIAGLLGIVGVFFQSYAMFFVLVPALLVALITTVYSYVVYRQMGNS